METPSPEAPSLTVKKVQTAVPDPEECKLNLKWSNIWSIYTQASTCDRIGVHE